MLSAPLSQLSQVTHFHFCGGSGLMALGMQEAHARVGTLAAEMACLGGIDADPNACADFERLVGVRQTCADLFTVEQFRAFHATCRTARKRCHRCNNTGEPPADWREVTPDDVRRAAQGRTPDIVCTSSPCKGLSGLLSPGLAGSARYQALNGLTVRCVRLMCEAWGDDPPPLFIFENVPLIATRGRGLLDEIKELLDFHGYAAAETFHDCGELGGLAQRRRRFLLVARHRAKVPPFLYEPTKKRVRGVGEVIGPLPLPDAPEAGPMHRCPRLTWETWVRLALIPAGGDWRSLEGMDFTRLGIAPLADDYGFRGALGVTDWRDAAGAVSAQGRPATGVFNVADPRPAAPSWHHGAYGVQAWDGPAATVTGGASPSTGIRAISDPRTGNHGSYQTYRVLRFDEPSPAIISKSEPGQGGYTVADPRAAAGWAGAGKYHVAAFDEPARAVIAANGTGNGASSVADPRWGGGGLGVQPWDEPAGTVAGESYPTNGRFSVQDPRLGAYGQHGSKLRVEGWEKPAHTVTGSDRVGSGAPSVADPRLPAFSNLCRVESWNEPAHAVVGASRPAGGALSVADPRVEAKSRRDDYQTAGHYGILAWSDPARAVTAHGQHDNGAFSVADPRPLPAAQDRPDPVPVIFALDGTWHRPFTTLELAALQDFPIELLMGRTLAGSSHTAWREHIGNGVPRASARAVGSEMARTLLMARLGQTFRLSATPIWVAPVAAALSLDIRPLEEMLGPRWGSP